MCTGESLYQGKVPDLSHPALETHTAAAGSGLTLRGPARISSIHPPPTPAPMPAARTEFCAHSMQPKRSPKLRFH